MWGFCGSCYYRDVCRGGCTWTSHSLLGKAGNNPYCHHRAVTLAERGRRERVVKVEDAPDAAFAVGRFALVEESLDGGGDEPVVVTDVGADDVLEVLQTTAGGDDPGNGHGRIPPRLRQCRGCLQFVHEVETTCPFCEGDLAALDLVHEAESARRRAIMDDVRAKLAAAAAEPGGP
jgi:hypothetical protein